MGLVREGGAPGLKVKGSKMPHPSIHTVAPGSQLALSGNGQDGEEGNWHQSGGCLVQESSLRGSQGRLPLPPRRASPSLSYFTARGCLERW